MKHFVRALLLLSLGLVLMCPVAMAQDALSAILPSPESTRVGSQLIYVYEDSLTTSALLRNTQWQSFMTVTNTSITTSVQVHFQFYNISGGTACSELFDFYDYLTQGKVLVIDPKAVRRVNGTQVGTATDGRYLLTITAINPLATAPPADVQAYAFNYLTGQLWVSDIVKSATYMTNAVARMAVNQFGTPLGNYTGPIIGGFGSPTAAGSVASMLTNYHFQYFRPRYLVVNSFFKTTGAGAVQAGVPFGNRLTIVAISDQYTNASSVYKIQSASANLNSFVFDNNELAYSVPQRTATCVSEWTIAPDTSATGQFTDFLSPSGDLAVSGTGGWLRMQLQNLADSVSVFGWFSQYLGTFGGGDMLIGVGRQGMTTGVWLAVTGINNYNPISNPGGGNAVTSTELSNSALTGIHIFP